MKISTTVWALVFVLSLAGCEGKKGPAGPPGPGIPTYTMTFQPGVSPVTTYTCEMNRVDAFNPTIAYPNDGNLNFYSSMAGISRVLFRFPVEDYLPNNCKVTAAALELTVLSSTGNPVTVGVHAIPVTACDWDSSTVCWDYYFSTSPWGNCGGTGPFTFGLNFPAAPMDTVAYLSGDLGKLAWNLDASVVQAWTKGAQEGVVITSENEGNNLSGFWSFAGLSYSNLYLRPTLVVQYQIP